MLVKSGGQSKLALFRIGSHFLNLYCCKFECRRLVKRVVKKITNKILKIPLETTLFRNKILPRISSIHIPFSWNLSSSKTCPSTNFKLVLILSRFMY